MKKCLYLLLALMAFATSAWAQNSTTVNNETDLRTALSSNSIVYIYVNGGNIDVTSSNDLLVSSNKVIILVGSNITCTNARFHVVSGGSLVIQSEYDNQIIGHGNFNGRAIYIESGGSCILQSGTVTAANNSVTNGGVIYNEGTLEIEGGTVSSGKATNGGGIYNTGTFTMGGGTIIGGSATNGGAIYNVGTLTINEGTIGSDSNPNTASNKGGGIFSTGTLTISGGSIRGNKAGNGAAINLYGGTFNMTGGSITGNQAENYAGIQVDGIFNMSGGSISGNTATNSYGGLRVNGSGTFNMTGGSISGNTATNHGGIYVNGTLNMSGRPIVMGNLVTPANGAETTCNVYLPSGKKITVNGAFTTGATVGVTCQNGENTTFTNGFGTNSPDNQTVFSSDNLAYTVMVLENEAKLVDYKAPTISDHNVPYLNVLEDGDHGTAYRELCMKMSSVSTDNPILTQNNASGGWYVLDQNRNFNKRISIQDGDTVNLIITDSTVLNANKGIDVPSGATLHIWGQSDPLIPTAATGVINSFAQENGDPGIGGSGYLYIHGGGLCAIGGTNAAGVKGAPDLGEGKYGLFIYGGVVISVGGENGAGIGGGMDQVCGGIKITGGLVYAKGNYKAAGIGAGWKGWTCSPPQGYSGNPSSDWVTEIRITGGEITAVGGLGAGIGGGAAADTWQGLPAIVYIDGGTVDASTDDGQPTNSKGAVAIGRGDKGMDMYDYLHIYDNAKVSASTSNNGGLTLQSAANGRSDSKYTTFKQMKIEPCDHPNGTNYSDNGSSLNVGCNHCLATEPYTFQSAGNWNDASKWLGNFTPGNGKNVTVKAAATIPSSCCAHVGNIDMQQGGSLTIADGGQLIHSNAGVTATVEKSIAGYTQAQSQGENKANGWYFIASPISTALEPSNVTNMLSGNYDLYRFNPTAQKEWENFKNQESHPDFTLNNGAGYLYANQSQVTLGFTGELKPYSEADGANQVSLGAGWNLVGNPFACNVYANQPFYKMNDALTGLSAELPATTTIAPCEGVIIDAATAGTVSFTQPSQASAAPSHGSLQIALSQEATERGTEGREALMDNAIVSFDEGATLGKFYFGKQNANIYLPQDGEEYAIAYSDKQGEMPLNFKARENGTYTLTVNTENVEVGYLHLIDNMTGADIDLLQTPSYSFEAKTTDYESRFKLVFASEDANDDDEAFAFISNGNLIVNGTGTLQVIDLLGRQLSSQEIHSSFSIQHSAFPTGVYVLRLINGNDVKTQKIVVE